MDSIENIKKLQTYTNKRNENIELNRNFDRISPINTPLAKKMLTETINESNNIIDNLLGCLIYKSIFHSLEKKQITNNNNNNQIEISNNKDKRKNYIINTSNRKIHKNPK